MSYVRLDTLDDSGNMELMKESDRKKPGEDKQDMDFEEISEEKKEVSEEEDSIEDEKEYEAEATVNRKPFPLKGSSQKSCRGPLLCYKLLCVLIFFFVSADRKRKLNTEVKDSMVCTGMCLFLGLFVY